MPGLRKTGEDDEEAACDTMLAGGMSGNAANDWPRKELASSMYLVHGLLPASTAYSDTVDDIALLCLVPKATSLVWA